MSSDETQSESAKASTSMKKETTTEEIHDENGDVIYIVKDVPDMPDVYTEYLDTLGFKLREIEQKFGHFEAKVAALQLHECICRFEKEAALRSAANV